MRADIGNLRGMKRTRRHLTKAAGLVVGAVFGLGAGARSAGANHRPWHGGGGGGGVCFLRGTRIATPNGDCKVEDLTTGDFVLANFGGVCPIKSIRSFGYVRNDAAPWSDLEKPVRVVQSALDDNVPQRDLYLTPAHALFVDGVLVPVGSLVNGASIIVDDADDHDTLEYFHIELERHDVIQAENTPCETLLAAEQQRCAPLVQFIGGRSQLKSRIRSALAPLVDRRHRLDVIRDRIEERGLVSANAFLGLAANNGRADIRNGR
jgi:hypothetical protein